MEESPFLMKINKGERMYKIFIFRPIAGRKDHFEYRILTKEKIDGNLEMVSYNFKLINGVPYKSGVTRAPDVPKESLDEIIQGIIRRTNTSPEEFEEVDLSCFATVDEQIAYLKSKDLADTSYMH